jgi:HD-like signal output (HDOD) protein
MHPPALPPAPIPPPAWSDQEVRRRIEACPKLASLQSVNAALSRLVKSDVSRPDQVAEVIQLDPSLTERLLRMVNLVYFGISARITSLEEAVFFLGFRQIRELALTTPIIEELDHVRTRVPVPIDWKALWGHSIGTAMMTREVLACALLGTGDDTDYLVGLLHNVGKIVMAYAFPDELGRVVTGKFSSQAEICALERQLIGWDHAQIGAHFLERHHLSDELSNAVRYHHDPAESPGQPAFPAAVQIAECLARSAGVGRGFEDLADPAEEAWTDLPGWRILFSADGPGAERARFRLAKSAAQLPRLLRGVL